MEGDARAIAEYLRQRRWQTALDRVDEFIHDYDNPHAEVTDTKTMDMYEAIDIISPAVQLYGNLPPPNKDEYPDDNEKYEAAWTYIYNLRTLINVAFRNLAGPAGGRRRSKRGKTAKQRRRTLTRRRRR
jgi:hypothetical protein